MIQLVNMPAGWLAKKLSFSALKEKSKAHKSLLNKNKNKNKKIAWPLPINHPPKHTRHSHKNTQTKT